MNLKFNLLRPHDRLELHADVARSFILGDGTGEVSMMVFTRRSERRHIGEPTSVLHQEFNADVEIKVTAKQAPEDPEERRGWLTRIMQHFEQSGYDSRIYFRHMHGRLVQGSQRDPHISGAADLLLCSRETISLSAEPRRWRSKIDPHIVGEMKKLLERDELWERTK